MESLNKISPIEENLIEGCDQKSAIYCSMFNALQTILTPEGQNVLKNNNIEKMAYSDLSALGLYIGKYVEQEINSSIVQLMRSIVGIEMPEFYCKRDCSFPIHKDEVYTGKTTRLNEKMPGSDRFDTLKPIPLGDAYHACMQLVNEDRSQFLGYEWIFEYRFKDIWRNLFIYRNRIAHAGDIISREDLIKNYELFLTFLKNYMPLISELKRDLAPEGYFDTDESAAEQPHESSVEEETEEQSETPMEDLPRPTKEMIDFVEMMEQNIAKMDFDDPEWQKLNEKYAEYKNNYNWHSIIFEGENGKKGMMDVKGNVLIPAKYDDFQYTFVLGYHMYMVPAVLDGKIGFVLTDGSGTEVTDFVYDSVHNLEFSSYFLFRKDDSISFGILSPNGEELVPCILDRFYERFSASIMFASGDKYGLIQTNEGILIPPIYDNIEMVDEPEDPLVFTLNGVVGYVTFDKQLFISKEKYDELLENGDPDGSYGDFECLVREQYDWDW